MRFHISQLIIFHSTPPPLPHFTMLSGSKEVFFAQKRHSIPIKANCVQFEVLFHSAVLNYEQIYSVLVPKHCKSAQILAQPSGKGQQLENIDLK